MREDEATAESPEAAAALDAFARLIEAIARDTPADRDELRKLLEIAKQYERK